MSKSIYLNVVRKLNATTKGTDEYARLDELKDYLSYRIVRDYEILPTCLSDILDEVY